MKKIFKTILWILVIILVAGYVAGFDNVKKFLIGNSSQESNEQEEYENELKEQLNWKLYVKDDLFMNDTPTLVFDSTTGLPSIRYSCTFEGELAENESLVLLVAQRDDLDRVNEDKFTYIPWVEKLEEYGCGYSIVEEYNVYAGEKYFLFDGSAGLKGLEGDNGKWFYNEKVNTSFVGLAAVKQETTDKNGNPISYYFYAQYADGNYRSNAKSFAQIANDMLNADAAIKNEEEKQYTDIQTNLRKIINASVDFTSGLKNPTENNSVYTFTPKEKEKTLQVDKPWKITGEVEPNNEMSLLYVSANETIAMVTQDGTVTGVTPGTTDIIVYLNGVGTTITLTVK